MLFPAIDYINVHRFKISSRDVLPHDKMHSYTCQLRKYVPELYDIQFYVFLNQFPYYNRIMGVLYCDVTFILRRYSLASLKGTTYRRSMGHGS